VVFLGRDEKIKASFDKLAKLFEDEHRLVSAITFATNQRMDKRIEEIEKTAEEILRAAKRAEIGVNAIQQGQQGQLRDNILDWISSTNFPAQQYDFIARREEGTGNWFLNAPEFDNWIRGLEPTLFCPGMPGAGKTMMAAMVIDHLSRTIQNDHTGVAYVYCNYKVRVDRHATSLLTAILRQLVQAQLSIPEPISRLYEHYHTSGTRPSAEEIYSALQSVLRYYSSVYLVVDALDECLDGEGTRPPLLAKLRGLQRGADVDLHLMVISRDIPEIAEEFKLAPSLEVRASDEDGETIYCGPDIPATKVHSR
jgi:Cdc6-like AAA superfamily ATPase